MRIGSEILLDRSLGDEEENLLDLRNLRNLVRHGEGLRLEFKMKVKFPEKIIKELVAFANTEGGHLFVGVSDAGVIEGVKFAEEEQFLLERAIEKFEVAEFMSITGKGVSGLAGGRRFLLGNSLLTSM